MALSKLDALLAVKGLTKASFRSTSRLGKVFGGKGVPSTPDLDRIVALPHYVWQDDAEIPALADYLTEILGLPKRTDCPTSCVCKGTGSMTLRPVQAAALQAIHDYGGMLGPIRVGGGKTIITYCAAGLIGAERPLLLVAAKLRHKTERDFSLLARHWCGVPVRVLSYELLSRDRGVAELEEYAPDIIIADEAHKLKNTRAACTRRIRRYLDDHEVAYVDLSGTITKRSVMEYHHRSAWALGPDRMPLPRHYNEAADWGLALDEKVKPENRKQPGALATLCTDSELTTLTEQRGGALPIIRGAYQRRLTSIPGVVGTRDDAEGGMSLVVTHRQVEMPDAVRSAFDTLRDLWETPGGEPFSQAVDLWRHARELVCGFYYKWDPPAPPEWLQARRDWAKFVRETLKHSRTMDTEMQVARACSRGELPDAEYQMWVAVRDSFVPNNVPVWISTAVLDDAARWLSEGPGIVWVEHVAFGERLAELTGHPYFGRQGVDAKSGANIETCKGGPIIASIAANCEGRNLQDRWYRNYIPSAPPSGLTWEQMLARTHRDGQEADAVEVDVVLACIEQWKAFDQARKDADYQGQTLGQPQKLQIADIDVPTQDEILQLWADPLWRTK